MEETPTSLYSSINEEAARRAKQAYSFYDYRPGSATAEYRQSVDQAREIAERQKARVDPMYHGKIDRLLACYARKLAANMNHRFAIDARVPSVLIVGPANFPVRAKEKQVRAMDSNMQEWRDIQGLLQKIRSTGMGGISADDPQAVEKLKAKLSDLEQSQETMKVVNAYYRKHKTLDGCPHLKPETIEKLKASMSHDWRADPKPFESYELSNNNANMHRLRERIESLERKAEIVFPGWQFDGGTVEANREENRLQILFDEKPDADKRAALKKNGFRWAPTAGAWQRQLNRNAYFAANDLDFIKPITGEKPTELERKARAKPSVLESIKEAQAAYKPRHYKERDIRRPPPEL